MRDLYTVRYVIDAISSTPKISGLREFHRFVFKGLVGQSIRIFKISFESKEVFEFSMAQFLMLVALANAVHNDDQQFYPGYRLLPEAQASRAMSALSSRLRGRPDYRDKIAKNYRLQGWSDTRG